MLRPPKFEEIRREVKFGDVIRNLEAVDDIIAYGEFKNDG